MQRLPEVVIVSREIANAQFDALQQAWEALDNIENPELQDLENWLEAKKRFEIAQDKFESLLKSFLLSALNS